MQVHEKLHHDFGGMQLAAAIMQQALNTVKNTGVDKALIKILKTVRNWPSRINEDDSDVFAPPFNATEIRAEETEKDEDKFTKVSFYYSGESYDFTFRTKKDSSGDNTPSTISLHENGEQVIDVEIAQDDSPDEFRFGELNSFKFGTWVDNIVRIEEEIEAKSKGLVE